MPDAGRLQLLSMATQAALAAVALSSAGAAAVAVPYAAYLESLPPRTDVALLDLELSEALYGMMGLAQALASVGAAILFMAWFHRLYSNVASLTGQTTAHEPKWAIWGFIVPLLNLFRPQQIMRESWDVMVQHWLREDVLPAALIPRDLVTLWWGSFLAMSLINTFAARFDAKATFAKETLLSTHLMQFSDACEAGAAIIALLMVRNITSLQHVLIARPPLAEGVTA